MKAFRDLALVDRSQHAPQQVVIVLVAIGLEVEIFRHLGEALVADRLTYLCMKRS